MQKRGGKHGRAGVRIRQEKGGRERNEVFIVLVSFFPFSWTLFPPLPLTIEQEVALYCDGWCVMVKHAPDSCWYSIVWDVCMRAKPREKERNKNLWWSQGLTHFSSFHTKSPDRPSNKRQANKTYHQQNQVFYMLSSFDRLTHAGASASLSAGVRITARVVSPTFLVYLIAISLYPYTLTLTEHSMNACMPPCIIITLQSPPPPSAHPPPLPPPPTPSHTLHRPPSSHHQRQRQWMPQ